MSDPVILTFFNQFLCDLFTNLQKDKDGEKTRCDTENAENQYPAMDIFGVEALSFVLKYLMA